MLFVPRFGRDFDGEGRNLDISRMSELKLISLFKVFTMVQINDGTHNEKGTPFASIDDMEEFQVKLALDQQNGIDHQWYHISQTLIQTKGYLLHVL